MAANQEKEARIDFISIVPDETLHHILSFLSTKEAVATSVLSRRWRNLWRPPSLVSLLHLELNDVVPGRRRIPNEDTLFESFVGNVLDRVNMAAVRSVTLSCLGPVKVVLINEWLIRAFDYGHNIAELQVYVNVGKFPISLPSKLVTSTSLVVLKLDAHINIDLRLYDGLVTFPSLKVLYIFVHDHRDKDLTDRLYSSCPVLEDLFLQSLMLPHEGRDVTFEVRSETLKKLRIELTLSNRFTYLYHYTVVIRAKNLEWLDLSNNYAVSYVLHDELDHLILDRAKLRIGQPSMPDYDRHFDYNEYEYDVRAFETLNDLSKHVKSLSLSGCTMRVVSYVIERQLEDAEMDEDDFLSIPTFPFLTDLDLGFRDYRSWSILPKILECSPGLEFLALEKEVLDGDQFAFDNWLWREPEDVPMCMLRCLKQIGIKGFQGKQYELTVVQFLLRNALVLEKMIICAPRLPADKETTLGETIFGYEKGSQACQVFFFTDGALLEP